LRYGEGWAQADRRVYQIAERLRAGKVKDVIARLKRLHRMRCDEYLRLGYGTDSGDSCPAATGRNALERGWRTPRHLPATIPADLRPRLEAARLDLLALFRALDRWI
jgi:hypothetical protein